MKGGEKMGPEVKNDKKTVEEKKMEVVPHEYIEMFQHSKGTLTLQQIVDARIAEYYARCGMPKKTKDT